VTDCADLDGCLSADDLGLTIRNGWQRPGRVALSEITSPMDLG
jgi:hypothetical protein